MFQVPQVSGLMQRFPQQLGDPRPGVPVTPGMVNYGPPVPGAPDPEQAQVPGEIGLQITEESEEKLVKKLKREYDAFKTSASSLHQKIELWHKLYESRPGPEKKFPWPGASNFSVPLIMSTVDSMHARLMKAVFEVDPIWLARPKAPQAVGAATKAQWYLDHWADEMEIGRKLDVMTHNMLIEGVGIAKIDWVRESRQLPADGLAPPGTPAQTVTEYEGPDLTPVPLKDFVLIPAEAASIDDAVYVGHRVWRNRQQLERAARQGYYANVQKLFEKSKDGDSTAERTNHPSNLVSPHSADVLDPETHIYEIVELYGLYDFSGGNDGGAAVPAIFTFSPQHEILLRVDPHPYEYGRAPYVDFQIYPRANHFWGRSVPDILQSIQDELTAFHNMRSDALTRRIAPPLLARKGSGWDPKQKYWAPGQVIEVNDPSEIIEMNLADIPGSVFSHEQDLLAFSERVSGMSDYYMGRSPTQNRTATEVNRVTSEGLARMDVSISRYQMSMKRLAWHLWWMLYQYRPFWDYFYAENSDMMITKLEMRPVQGGLMPFEFVPQGMLSDSSKEAQRQQYLTLLQTVMGPLTQFYPDGIQYLLDKILASFDIQDRAQILGPSWDAIQQQIQAAYQQGQQEGAEQAAAAAAEQQGG